MATTCQQRYAPGKGTPWVYDPDVVPPSYLDGLKRAGRAELSIVADKILQWTKNSSKLPDEYWMKTREKGHDIEELHLTVLKAVKVLFKKPYCQFAP